jgi:hypothetical protein
MMEKKKKSQKNLGWLLYTSIRYNENVNSKFWRAFFLRLGITYILYRNYYFKRIREQDVTFDVFSTSAKQTSKSISSPVDFVGLGEGDVRKSTIGLDEKRNLLYPYIISPPQ